MVFDDDGGGLYRFEHSADAYSSAEVHLLAYLGAGADRGPGIYHRAFVHVGAYIDVRGHHHYAPCQIGAIARHSRGYDAYAEFPVVALEVHLVVVFHFACVGLAQFPCREVEYHGLLYPVVHLPASFPVRFGGTQFALVEQFDHFVHRSLRFEVPKERMVFPYLLYQPLQLFMA